MSFTFFGKQRRRDVKSQWKHAYRRLRLRRKANLTPVSAHDDLLRAHVAGESPAPGRVRRLAYGLAAVMAVMLAWSIRLITTRS